MHHYFRVIKSTDENVNLPYLTCTSFEKINKVCIENECSFVR